MNDEQLDGLLKALKSSWREPDAIDHRLEERLIKEQGKMTVRRRRVKLAIAVAAVFLVSGVGFVASGGDMMVARYAAASPQESEKITESPVLTYMHGLLRHVHDHLRRLHGPGPDHTEQDLHSYDEQK
jgi:hypothetical protein